MAKFPRTPKLSHKYTQELIVDLCEAIASTGTSGEAAELLTDLLGKQELEMIAKRLRIAEYLLENKTYDEIKDRLKTSGATIARVQIWLHQAGEGYRRIIEKTKRKRNVRLENERPIQIRGMKKRYPMYYWPQIMLEFWIKNASKKQKDDMYKILAKLNKKSFEYRKLEFLLSKQKFHSLEY